MKELDGQALRQVDPDIVAFVNFVTYYTPLPKPSNNGIHSFSQINRHE